MDNGDLDRGRAGALRRRDQDNPGGPGLTPKGTAARGPGCLGEVRIGGDGVAVNHSRAVTLDNSRRAGPVKRLWFSPGEHHGQRGNHQQSDDGDQNDDDPVRFSRCIAHAASMDAPGRFRPCPLARFVKMVAER